MSLGRQPTTEKLAKATGLKLHHVEEALDAVEASVSLNQAVGSDGDGELGDLFADRTSPTRSRRPTSRSSASVFAPLSRGYPSGARVLELRFGFDGQENLTLEEIGRVLELTRERVRQLEKAALTRLQHALDHDARPLRPARPRESA